MFSTVGCERPKLTFDTLFQGLVAGYGIAVPVGPIGILIIELGIRRGFRVAFSGGLGAASADLIYATTAALAGTFLASILSPISTTVRIVSALGLIAIGVWLFYRGRQPERNQGSPDSGSTSCLSTYGLILGLTLLNPLTVTYFTTLILGLKVTVARSPVDVLLFVAGTFLASFSWQTLLAGISGLSHKRLSTKVQRATFALGNCVVITLGILILIGFPI
jgi:arginine exporter protein ArgO